MKKYVLVTGASAGTGYAICERFAREGYGVILTSRSANSAEDAARRLTEKSGVYARGFGLSAGCEGDVQALFQTLRKEGQLVTQLVLNAADLGMNQNALETSYEDWMRVIETNLGWNFTLMREAARHMKECGGGSIVIIGSNTARRAIANRSAYIASKGGLVSLCKALAVEWGEFNIRVNIIISGSIKTARYEARTEEDQRRVCARAPIGDIAAFEDIANAAYFLASDESRVITGAELAVDGGVDAQFVPRSML